MSISVGWDEMFLISDMLSRKPYGDTVYIFLNDKGAVEVWGIFPPSRCKISAKGADAEVADFVAERTCVAISMSVADSLSAQIRDPGDAVTLQ